MIANEITNFCKMEHSCMKNAQIHNYEEQLEKHL